MLARPRCLSSRPASRPSPSSSSSSLACCPQTARQPTLRLRAGAPFYQLNPARSFARSSKMTQPAQTAAPNIEIEANWWKDLPAEVRYVPGKGRGLFTRRRLDDGENIIATIAYVWNVYEQYKDTICSWCMRDVPKTTDGKPEHQCQACRQLAYCSAECKEADSALHQALECGVFKEWSKVTDSLSPKGVNEMRTLARVLTTRAWEDGPAFKNARPIIYRDYKKLHVGKELLERKSLKHITSVAERLSTLEAKPKESVDEMVDILSRNRRNAFCEQSFRTYEVIGCSVFVAPSLFNHSCESNVLYRVQHQGKHVPRSIEWYADGVIAEGTELTISYLDDDKKKKNYKERRDHLYKTFSFVCHCPRCDKEEQADLKAP